MESAHDSPYKFQAHLNQIEADLAASAAAKQKFPSDTVALTDILVRAKDIQTRLQDLRPQFQALQKQASDLQRQLDSPTRSISPGRVRAEKERLDTQAKLQAELRKVEAAISSWTKLTLSHEWVSLPGFIKEIEKKREEAINDKVNEVLEKYREVGGKMVGVGRGDKIETGLTRAELETVIRTAFRVPVKPNETCVLSIGDQKYLLSRKPSRDGTDHLALSAIKPTKRLAEGMSRVVASWSVLKGKLLIEKTPVEDYNVVRIAKEYQDGLEKMELIHEAARKAGGKRPVGIEPLKHYMDRQLISREYRLEGDKLIEGPNQTLRMEGGILHARRAKLGDLVALFNEESGVKWPTLEVRINMAGQLLKALAQLEQLGILHGDIKLENVLVDMEDEEFRLYLTDFDSAKFLNTPGKACELDVSRLVAEKAERQKNRELDRTEGWGNVSTPAYTSRRDRNGLRALVEEAAEGSNSAAMAIQKRYNDLQLKRDVFAMGIVICGLLTRQPFPFRIGKSDGLPWPSVREDLKIQGQPELIAPWIKQLIPQEFLPLLEHMLQVDPNERYTAEEALVEYNKIMGQSTVKAA